MSTDGHITPKRNLPKGDEEHLNRYKRNIDIDADAVWLQRDQANEDMRFVNVDGGMWESWFETGFKDRVKLEVNFISPYLRRFMAEWNTNRVGVSYKPHDSTGNTSEDDAEFLNSIHRADFRDGSGKMALDNAVLEAATCGYGAYRIRTEFEDKSDKENEMQKIVFEPIYNAFNLIIWDRSSQRIDKRDARRCVELLQFTRTSFKEKYPDSEPISAYTPLSRKFLDESNAPSDMIFIAVLYEAIEVLTKVFVYSDLTTGKPEFFSEEEHKKKESELKRDPLKKFVRARDIVEQQVWKSVFSGSEFLEEPRPIIGEFIPIVPVYAYRGYVNGSERSKGLVRELKDLNRVFNTTISKVTEVAGASGFRKPILAPEQIVDKDGKPNSVLTQIANRGNKAAVVIPNIVSKDGKIIAPGIANYLEPPTLDQSTLTLLEVVPNLLSILTGDIPNESADPDRASGKALIEKIKRVNQNTQPILDNISSAIEWGGEIYQSIASEVYSERRLVNTLAKDGTASSVNLLELGVDESSGRIVTTNDLTGKKFKAYADTGPQYDTDRQRTLDQLIELFDKFSANPSAQKYTPAILDIILSNLDGVGLDPLKKQVRMSMILSGAIPAETDEEKQTAELATQQQQEDPNQALIDATAQNQASEAASFQASAEQKDADADLKRVKAAEIAAKIRTDELQVILDAVNAITNEPNGQQPVGTN